MAQRDVRGSRGGEETSRWEGELKCKPTETACLGLFCRKGDGGAGEVVRETVLPSPPRPAGSGVGSPPPGTTKTTPKAIRRGKYQTCLDCSHTNYRENHSQISFCYLDAQPLPCLCLLHTRSMKHHGIYWTMCGKKTEREVYVQPWGACLLPHTLTTCTAHPALICSESIDF